MKLMELIELIIAIWNTLKSILSKNYGDKSKYSINYRGQYSSAQTKEYITARKTSLQNQDKNNDLKDAYENPEIKELYNTYLGRPLSKTAEKLLHTSYHSKSNKAKYLKQ